MHPAPPARDPGQIPPGVLLRTQPDLAKTPDAQAAADVAQPSPVLVTKLTSGDPVETASSRLSPDGAEEGR